MCQPWLTLKSKIVVLNCYRNVNYYYYYCYHHNLYIYIPFFGYLNFKKITLGDIVPSPTFSFIYNPFF